MLDSVTKRRIDTCRDILVGKIPDPKSQVEQITIALIYKFMDDMDLESEELGGARKFFTGEFERYAWGKLVAPGTSGQDMLNTYGEALQRMTENEKLPALFRDIFRNAYLPYRDPETLRSFLREINGFTYDHSERLGDAFEYLLSVLGSQGDAGQFRTPRHIIDFMVEIIDPKKDDVILDPACGTAGFLISSYKHILKANSSATEVDGNGESESAVERPIESPLRFAGDLLTGEDRQRLARNIKGYDISPDMVRLSLVNLYLHGFANPRVEEYDTLTSDDKWSEMADVILANPPFMSPKGGIRPHNRFSISASRSEVLFVDYIAGHLTPKGRAAVIVPEGVSSQSGSAYKALRKMLVENFLVAVVSLPAGVFNPYSGVKTSILVFDRVAAKASDAIGFFKIANDGFNLGAQRRAQKGSQLPRVEAQLGAWLTGIRSGEDGALESSLGFSVDRARIAEDGEYNLSGDRYAITKERTSTWPMVRLGDLVSAKSGDSTIIKGTLPTERGAGLYPAYSATGQDVFAPTYAHEGPGIVVSAVGARCGKCFRADGKWQPIANTHAIIADEKVALTDYLFLFLNDEHFWIKGGSAQPFVKVKASLEIKIPLPPLEVQREIVAEIEGYQKVIDGARAVLENYRPHIPIDPEWSFFQVGDLARPEYGFTASARDEGVARFVRITDISDNGTLRIDGAKFVDRTPQNDRYLLRRGDVLVARTGATFGKTMMFDEDYNAIFASYLIRLRFSRERVDPGFYWAFSQSDFYWNQANALVTGGGQPQFNGNALSRVRVPLPPLETQRAIVAELAAERTMVEGNRQLIARMEAKIEAAIARVWGGTDSTAESLEVAA